MSGHFKLKSKCALYEIKENNMYESNVVVYVLKMNVSK